MKTISILMLCLAPYFLPSTSIAQDASPFKKMEGMYRLTRSGKKNPVACPSTIAINDQHIENELNQAVIQLSVMPERSAIPLTPINIIQLSQKYQGDSDHQIRFDYEICMGAVACYGAHIETSVQFDEISRELVLRQIERRLAIIGPHDSVCVYKHE